MGDKSQGHYARLALVDADGNEMEKHFVRDMSLYVCMDAAVSVCRPPPTRSYDPARTPH